MVTYWEQIDRDEDIIEILFRYELFDDISSLIGKNKRLKYKLTKEHFFKAIEKQETEMILIFLQRRSLRDVLISPQIQKNIVNHYLTSGGKVYYGAEMLNFMNKSAWDNNLTKDFCRNILKMIKNREILNCHSPILTAILLCEHLIYIGDINIQNKQRCQKVVEDLSTLVNNIQETSQNEKYVKFLMTQKDAKARSALQIASDNDVYKVLESAEIGTIVRKMWNGKLSHAGFLEASSIYRNLDDKNASSDPYKNFKSPMETTVYYHQLYVWMDSCSMRYLPENIVTIFIIFVFNFFIYRLVNTADIMDKFEDLSSQLKLLIYTYIFLSLAVNLGTLNQFIFHRLSGRKFRMDIWNYSEIFMFIGSVALLYDTRNLSEDGTTDGEKDFPFLVRAFILAANEVLVWARITGILLTFKDIGPLIRMIYLMVKLLTKYLVIYVLYTICLGSIFTLVFYNSSSQFEKFATSMTTLFSGFIQNLDTDDFFQRKEIGQFSLMFYVTFSGVMLINLLIAVLSNVYLELSRQVEAAHRAVLINYYKRYKWDKQWGFLIFLTSPLNLVNFAVLPFVYFSKDKKEANLSVCKMYYMLYFIPSLLTFIFVNLFFVPFAYLKGLIITIRNFGGNFSNFFEHLVTFFSWSLFSPLFMLFTIVKDVSFMLNTIFKPAYYHSSETLRVKSIIREHDVILFLKFINNRPADEPNDLHNIFLDYLSYETNFLSKHDTDIKEKRNYFDKLDDVTGMRYNKTSRSKAKSLILVTKRDKNEPEQNENESLKHPDPIKKNLIIIEILENFLIDDGTDNFIVDLKKLKQLLPNTHTVNNQYKKRLVFTDMKSVNKALGKLRKKVTQVEQMKQLEKVSYSSYKLNQTLDRQIAIRANKFGEEGHQNNLKNLAEIEYENNMAEMCGRVLNEIEVFVVKKNLENKIIEEESQRIKSQKERSISKRMQS